MNETNFIVFSKQDIPKVLEIFNKGIDNEGYIIDNKTKAQIKPRYNGGKPILAADLGNVMSGSEIFLKADMTNFVKYVTEKRKDLL